MKYITGKHIHRRKFLKGMGTTVALPFLSAMVPAGHAASRTEKLMNPTRLVAIEMVHGAAGSNEWGATQFMWAPEKTGSAFDLTPSALLPMEPYRNYMTIVSNTDVANAEAKQPSEIGGDHFRSSAVFLTQAHPKQTEGSDVFAGTSLDQMYAHEFGQNTPIPSMQLCIENINQSGGCNYGYTCMYTDSISWASPTEPLPLIRDPRLVFDQLFGAGGSAEERQMRRRTDKSILDWIGTRASDLKKQLGPEDQRRMDHYLTNVREIERRIQQIESRASDGEQGDIPDAPSGVPESFAEHVELMFDLQVLAFAADITRVFSFKMGRDASARVFPESGTDKPFHPCSHHGGSEEGVTDFYKINKYHVGMVPYLLEKLESTMEGDTHLLDKSMVIYGSPMGDSNLHNHKRCPLFVAGGANGTLPGNLHIKASDGTPMANAMLSVLHKLGLEDLESFGDSTGTLLS
ncbi:MAG: DUF1552 domain-containing protein [Woeseiaceae bacterium]|nr:DUF1552 domain-containing protein [Woeseiaceae bacterium]